MSAPATDPKTGLVTIPYRERCYFGRSHTWQTLGVPCDCGCVERLRFRCSTCGSADSEHEPHEIGLGAEVIA